MQYFIHAAASKTAENAVNSTMYKILHRHNDNAERVVAQAIAVIGALRGELNDRDNLMIEFQSAIDEKLEIQTKQIAEQSKTIAKLSEQIAEMERKQQEKPEPSLWSRIFGRNRI